MENQKSSKKVTGVVVSNHTYPSNETKKKSKIKGDLDPFPPFLNKRPKKYAKEKLEYQVEEINIHGQIYDFELQLELNLEKRFNTVENAQLFMDNLIEKHPEGEYIIVKNTLNEYDIYTNC